MKRWLKWAIVGVGLLTVGAGTLLWLYASQVEEERYVPMHTSIYSRYDVGSLPTSYPKLTHDGWTSTQDDAVSTFALDVDSASYTHAAAMVRMNRLPGWRTSRPEEFVNHFAVAYPKPEKALGLSLDGADSPMSEGRKLLRIGIQSTQGEARKPVHLTLLVDESGSMEKVQETLRVSMDLLLRNMQPSDTVAMVGFSDTAEIVLPPTSVSELEEIREALRRNPRAGGTAFSDGLTMAYDAAAEHFKADEVNRVVILSDGIANVGETEWPKMLANIKFQVDKGITMTTVTFGTDNDMNFMERLANNGDGAAFFVGGFEDADKIFRKTLMSTLHLAAKDARVQVRFNPTAVKSYRLIGYENREMEDEAFKDVTADAGEVGLGNSVTAFYELELLDEPTGNIGHISVRFRRPGAQVFEEVESQATLSDLSPSFEAMPAQFRFLATAAMFAELLQRPKPAHRKEFDRIQTLAAASAQDDEQRRMAQLAGQVSLMVASADEDGERL